MDGYTAMDRPEMERVSVKALSQLLCYFFGNISKPANV